MKQYIDKSAIMAEIYDWRDKIKKGIFSIPLHGNERAYATFEYEILGKVKDFLDTLEVKDANEALRTEYEKGRADVIADTISWLANVWPQYCSNPTIIDAYKEGVVKD